MFIQKSFKTASAANVITIKQKFDRSKYQAINISSSLAALSPEMARPLTLSPAVDWSPLHTNIYIFLEFTCITVRFNIRPCYETRTGKSMLRYGSLYVMDKSTKNHRTKVMATEMIAKSTPLIKVHVLESNFYTLPSTELFAPPTKNPVILKKKGSLKPTIWVKKSSKISSTISKKPEKNIHQIIFKQHTISCTVVPSSPKTSSPIPSIPKTLVVSSSSLALSPIFTESFSPAMPPGLEGNNPGSWEFIAFQYEQVSNHTTVPSRAGLLDTRNMFTLPGTSPHNKIKDLSRTIMKNRY
ncbi:unnamed protein product [Mytilus coruscus]|uniref:Uncharacterized protein n=1 Tax=Mytilus coruscus TaxID=42192 RepID=A0A6J8DWM6_MYTCO|nr:unnamed protein product [Mytilus coruscus]